MAPCKQAGLQGPIGIHPKVEIDRYCKVKQLFSFSFSFLSLVCDGGLFEEVLYYRIVTDEAGGKAVLDTQMRKGEPRGDRMGGAEVTTF